jgi:SAM-dependent methyltransferase
MSAGADDARAALAAEWRDVAPDVTDPASVLGFYRGATTLEEDLEQFHSDPLRRRWTELLCEVAETTKPRLVVDIGAGRGDDLAALHRAISNPLCYLRGVEPNERLRNRINDELCVCVADVEDADVEDADLLICIDVLEHVVDPEGWLGSIARRAKVGCILVETCATHDIGTPLHLRANRGWRPGRALELAGWERTFEEGRFHVWQRMREGPKRTTGLAICTYRDVSQPTFKSVLNLCRGDDGMGWRVLMSGEAGIARARSQVTSYWHTTTADDVLLMIDSDISFRAEDARRIVERCRSGYDVICAAYPTRDASHLALRGLGEEVAFGPDAEPVKVVCAATGFLAFSRRVIDALSETLPVVNANLEYAFRAFFDFRTVENEAVGGHEWLSEDYDFSEKAKAAGFPIWLDPSILLGHQAQVELRVTNMRAMRAVLDGGGHRDD